MSSAFQFVLILAFFVIYLNEDCRRHYQEVDAPGQQLSSARSGRIAPRVRRGKLLTQSSFSPQRDERDCGCICISKFVRACQQLCVFNWIHKPIHKHSRGLDFCFPLNYMLGMVQHFHHIWKSTHSTLENDDFVWLIDWLIDRDA